MRGEPKAWCIVSGDYDLRDTYLTHADAALAIVSYRRRFPALNFRIAEIEWVDEELGLIEPSAPPATRRAPSSHAGQH